MRSCYPQTLSLPLASIFRGLGLQVDVITNTVAEPSNVFLMYFLYLGQKAMGFFQKQQATELPSLQAIDFGIANEGTVTSTEEVTSLHPFWEKDLQEKARY